MVVNRKFRRVWLALGIVVVFLVVANFLLITTVKREWAYICVNTGSRKGHTEWMTGYRTKEWLWESSLESFVKREHPDILQHNWISYAGTGKNIFGGKTLHGHGRPGPIALMPKDVFNEWINQLSDSEKVQVYEALSSEDRERIANLIDESWDRVLSERQERRD